MRKLRPVTIGVHPSFYAKMEAIRKRYEENGIKMSQIDLTNIIGKKIKKIKIPVINLIGGKNVKKKGRSY